MLSAVPSEATARVLVTGATGLVGRALCVRLAAAGYTVRAAVRADAQAVSGACEETVTGDLAHFEDWPRALERVDFVVHAAARAHVLRSAGDRRDYLEINTAATARLASAAAQQGVKRFVYVSSIKVNGEDSGAGAFTADETPEPADIYGESKLAAEERIRQIAAAGSMEFAIVRPPLVYGPGVKANFLRLLRWVDRGYPLPFASLNNHRSMVSVWNLNDLVVKLLSHPSAASKVWLVSDGAPLSTPDLIRRIARALGRRAVLLPVPVRALEICGALAGRTDDVQRLCGSLVVDSLPAQHLLGWTAALSLDEGLARTVRWYRTMS